MRKNYIASMIAVCLSVSAMAKNGLYVEYKFTSDMMNGTSKTYVMDGNTRTETSMQMPGGQNMAMAMLVLKSEPGMVYMLNEGNKTYSQFETGKAYGSEDDDYTITIVGKENVNNHNCTHVSALDNKTKRTFEMWVSTDIANYSTYTSIKSKYYGNKLYQQMAAKGVKGYAVRLIIMDDRAGKTQMDLVAAENKAISSPLFSLDGYTKSGGVAQKGAPDPRQLQSMTPEQRQQYIQQMKEKYQQQH